MQVVNWDALIDSMTSGFSERDAFALSSAFRESNILYKKNVDKSDISACLENYQKIGFEFSEKILREFTVKRLENAFPFPHASSAFYYDNIYIASSAGIHSARYDHRDGDMPTKASKLSGIPAIEAWPSYGSLAVAAGEDGLFEFRLSAMGLSGEERQVSNQPCDQCEWMYQNIFAFSLDGHSVMAQYKPEPFDNANMFQNEEASQKIPDYNRNIGNILSGDDVFSPHAKINKRKANLVWGSQDKIYRLEGRQVSVFRSTKDYRTIKIGQFVTPSNNIEDLVSIRTSLFGVVFEFDRALIVVTSDGKTIKIDGEPVSWKVFPRSRHYENHLHAIWDDRIDVYSFNDDYSVDQFRKLVGNRAPEKWE
ncbi:hypothetical protein, partial [Azospirillum argentinense]